MKNLYNYKIIDSQSMATSLTSSAADMSNLDGYAIFAQWTGSPVGTIKLKVSVDSITYVDLSGSETVVNGAGDALWEVPIAFYDKVQVVFTRTSGTGTLNAQINGKGLPD